MSKVLPAHKAFYPAAALYAALALPVSVLAMTGHPGALAALADPMGHAHEMLLGFALAVVAGNQLGVVGGRRVAVLLALWLAARVAFLASPAGLAAGTLNAAFAGGLALHVAPRLFGSAKKLRNQALPAVLAALCVAGASWPLARRAGLSHELLLATVMLFALLMLFMGGRIIAPAVAGQLHRQGERLDARVQPRLEAALLISGGVALLSIGIFETGTLDAAAMAACGLLAAMRMARWRLWALRGRADLLCLAAGHGWLAAGLLALAVSLVLKRHETAAVHLITVGALGTLTFNVMAMSWLLKAHRAPGGSPPVVHGTVLIAAATLCRVIGAFQSQAWLLAAAGCWAAAYAVLLALFWRASDKT